MADDKRKSSLSKEQETKALEWLSKKWDETKHTCEICSSVHWMILGDIVTPSVYHPNGALFIGGNTYPQFMVMCQSCGNTKYFNAVMSGIIESPKPEEKKEEKTAEIQKEVRNIAIGTFISIGLTMLTVYFGDSKISNVASILFWVLLIVSACMFLQSFFICKNAEIEENASYIAPLDQALTIMTNFQNSMPNQNDNPQTSP